MSDLCLGKKISIPYGEDLSAHFMITPQFLFFTHEDMTKHFNQSFINYPPHYIFTVVKTLIIFIIFNILISFILDLLGTLNHVSTRPEIELSEEFFSHFDHSEALFSVKIFEPSDKPFV